MCIREYLDCYQIVNFKLADGFLVPRVQSQDFATITRMYPLKVHHEAKKSDLMLQSRPFCKSK